MYAGYTKTFGGLVDVVEFNTVKNIFHLKKKWRGSFNIT